MNNPLISVLVPIYNSEKHLEACLDSIINQKYKNIEIILVNDGSTDNSGAICDDYAEKDSRIKVLHQENKGVSDTRNTCISLANGSYIGFVDSDDTISPDMYSDMMKIALESDADMIVCNFASVKENGESKMIQPVIPFEKGEIPKADYMNKISSENIGALSIVWNKLYKSHLFDKIKYPSGKIHEDDATIHRICHACNKIYYIPNIYYFYKQTETSIMHSAFSVARLGSTDAILDRANFLAETGYSEEIIHNCEIFLINDFIRSIRNLNKKSKNDRKAIKEKFKLVKPYCKKLLKDEKTNKKDRKSIRLLLLCPFIFFYI